MGSKLMLHMFTKQKIFGHNFSSSQALKILPSDFQKLMMLLLLLLLSLMLLLLQCYYGVIDNNLTGVVTCCFCLSKVVHCFVFVVDWVISFGYPFVWNWTQFR